MARTVSVEVVATIGGDGEEDGKEEVETARRGAC
jgi:hypothetical protein